MAEITTVGVDLAKDVFPAHGADASGRAVLRRRLRRDRVRVASVNKMARVVWALMARGGICQSPAPAA